MVPCSDMCGTVVRSRADDMAPGTRVMAIFLQGNLAAPLREDDMATGLGFPLPGVLAEYRALPARSLVRVPAYLTAAEASTLPIAAVTAWTSINAGRPVGRHVGLDEAAAKARRTVLLQGTGGVAVAGLQIAHAAGLRTIVTSSSDDKLRRARDELGADTGINYRTHWRWQDEVLAATGGRGADIILETGGARTIRKSFEAVAFGGAINCIGYVTGKHDEGDAADGPALNVNVLALRRNVTLRGVVNGAKERFEEMVGFYAAHEIRPVVGREFGFGEAREAMAWLAGGQHFGKVVICVGEKK